VLAAHQERKAAQRVAGGDLAERLREAKGPLREFLVWQIAKRKA